MTRHGTHTITEERIKGLRQRAEQCEWVEFTRVLPDGRRSIGLATREDILALLDIIDGMAHLLHDRTGETPMYE